MICARNITKRFAGLTAVDRVSFEVARGEVVGLLGPNGAGKTTLLRMLTGYLAPSAGDLNVAGYPVTESSLEVRERIGYLPEACPLYPEMRVDEYLAYRAALKRVPRGLIRKRVDGVRERCGLADAGRRIIGNLSKGYRQRVGLADALVRDPDLLILDEPTSGLDPNQIREVRSLIRTLAERHTILLSTHILPEVEATCQRVLIMDRGRMVFSDTAERLRKRGEAAARIAFEVRAPMETARAELALIAPGAEAALREIGEGWVAGVLEADAQGDLRCAVFETATRCGWGLRELRLEKESLEDVFVSLTTRETDGGGT
jgi:ABC-2 type transport system ATP-binding protein